MRSLNNRVSNLEQRNDSKSKTPAAFVLIEDTDGAVTVRLPNDGGQKQFDNKQAARNFINKESHHNLPPFEVIMVNSQGKMPSVS